MSAYSAFNGESSTWTTIGGPVTRIWWILGGYCAGIVHTTSSSCGRRKVSRTGTLTVCSMTYWVRCTACVGCSVVGRARRPRLGLDVQTGGFAVRSVESNPVRRCECRSIVYRRRGKSTVSFPASSARVSRCKLTAYLNSVPPNTSSTITTTTRCWRRSCDLRRLVWLVI